MKFCYVGSFTLLNAQGIISMHRNVGNRFLLCSHVTCILMIYTRKKEFS